MDEVKWLKQWNDQLEKLAGSEDLDWVKFLEGANWMVRKAIDQN